LVNKM